MPCRTAAALPLPASSEGGVEGEREEEEEVTKSAGDLDKAASPSSSSCNHTEVKSVVIIGEKDLACKNYNSATMLWEIKCS